jgi:hypothetical protein
MTIEQVVAAAQLLASPPQPVNVVPVSGVTVMLTEVLSGYAAEQTPLVLASTPNRQSIAGLVPCGVTTCPDPVPLLFTVSVNDSAPGGFVMLLSLAQAPTNSRTRIPNELRIRTSATVILYPI